MNNEDDDFDSYDDADDNVELEAASDTITVRNGRFQKSWRDIERLREQREIDRLSTQDNWFDELDRSL